MKITTVIARFLLGFIFLVFGLNGFLHFIPASPPSGTAGQFVGALFVSHYLVPIFLLQIISAVLLLVNRYVPLALTLLAPIIVNILLINFREAGADELNQATAAVRAAKDAGVKHFVWSTLPNVEAISGGKFDVPHFTGKAKIDRIVKEAGFPHHTFVIAPGYYQNFVGFLAPQKQADGSVGWALPLDPHVRCLHMGDIRELGNIVAGAFAHPDQAGNGEYLPLVGDFMSFNEIVETLNRQGHKFSFKQVPKEVFAASFPGAAEIAEMISYWEAHTYLGSDSSDRIALANKIAGRQPTKFSTWTRLNVPVQTP